MSNKKNTAATLEIANAYSKYITAINQLAIYDAKNGDVVICSDREGLINNLWLQINNLENLNQACPAYEVDLSNAINKILN